MTTRNRTAPTGAQSQSAIRAALQGMSEVSGVLLTIRNSLSDEAAEQQQTLTVADRLLTKTHDDLERAEWAERAGTPAQVEPTEHVPAADEASADTTGPADTAAILKAVEAQRILLLNVHSTVRCLRFSEEQNGGELHGALELLEMETLRIITALEGPELETAASQGGES